MERRSAGFAIAFARAARGYWLGVFPAISRELRHWRGRAEQISDPLLRAHALAALDKRGNMEGAAAFATFVPRERRGAVVRAAVAFQAAYNHLDVLSEQASPNPVENSRQLHEALLVALDPRAPHVDYHAHLARRAGRDDGGYLLSLIERCQGALAQLPSYGVLADAARRAAERVVAFQVMQAGRGQGTDATLGVTASQAGLRWWETAAAGGSSLGVHVMIATAAETDVTAERVAAIEAAYHPWIGALHSLLDHLIDAGEDMAIGQRNLIDLYDSPEQAADRMAMLARRSLAEARALGPGRRHELIVAAMACFYLAAPEARTGRAAVVGEAVLEELGGLAGPALAVFRARRGVEWAGRALHTPRLGRPSSQAAQEPLRGGTA